MVHLLDFLSDLSLLCQYPAAQQRTDCYPERKILLLRDAVGGFRMLLHSRHLAAELMEHGGKGQDKTPAKGVRTLLRQRHRRVAPRQPLLRIATYPQRHSGKAVT